MTDQPECCPHEFKWHDDPDRWSCRKCGKKIATPQSAPEAVKLYQEGLAHGRKLAAAEAMQSVKGPGVDKP
jgi:ribosomal protein L37AE/L43A